MLGKFELFQFDWRGKCIKGLEGTGSAILKLWAMQNTNGKKLSVIRDVESKEIIFVVQGMGKDSFPKIIDDKLEIDKLGLSISDGVAKYAI